MIYILRFFLLGIAFIQWILPILDGIFSVIATFLEMVKGDMTIKITETNAKIQKLIDEEESEGKSRAIGFEVGNDDDE